MAKSIAPFWTKYSDEVVEELNSNPEKGLTQEEIKMRTEKASATTLAPNSHLSDFWLLFNQFRSPFMALLLFADILSFFLGEHVDAIIIFCIIILSGVLSFWQERGAQNIVRELLAMVKVTSKVLRDGTHQYIDLEKVAELMKEEKE